MRRATRLSGSSHLWGAQYFSFLGQGPCDVSRPSPGGVLRGETQACPPNPNLKVTRGLYGGVGAPPGVEPGPLIGRSSTM